MVNFVNKKVDVHLQQLEQLAIHKTIKIQSYGVLLVLSEPELTILQTSNNTQELLGITAEALVGESLETIFDTVQIEPIKFGLSQENWDYINPSKLWARLTGDNYTVFDAVFHR
ncbi:MAG: cyanobacterial phytochrome A, partial [Microcystaceae cyanobacterium]